MTTETGIEQTISVEELVALVLAGRTELYGEIVRRYQRDVFRVVEWLLYDRTPAEDLVQEVFLAAYGSLGRFQPGCDFRPWLLGIARNTVREELRKLARYDRRLKTYGQQLETRLREESTSSWEEDMHLLLQDCLDRLPARQALAVRLRYEEGQTAEQIAVVLDTTNGTVRNLLCHARASLRRCLETKAAQR